VGQLLYYCQNYSKKGFLDSMDWRETTYSGLICKQKISRKSGESIKILPKKDS
jgi:hypothetical protein